MLRFLKIRHLAVIEAVEVEFDPGLNVLTGETGAGKSILVEAVSLLLGGRASGDLVRTGEETASIEAIFENAGQELLVRREITAQGRSRAFVNGSLATASTLKDLSASLIELHGQHEHQTLLDPTTHLDILDIFGDLTASRAAVAEAFESLGTIQSSLSRLKSERRDRESRLELASFQLSELDRADLKPTHMTEDEELASLRKVLASAERIERLCSEAYATLYESDGAILEGLSGVWRRVGELATLDAQFQPHVEAREGIKSQLEDLATFLRRYADSIEASPARLQQVEERLALLERLKRKYGPTLVDVIARRDSLKREVAELETSDERTQELEREEAAARTKYLSAAGRLSKARRRAAESFAKSLEQELAQLAMESTRFEVRFDDDLPESSWSALGFDAAEFYVSPNPGEDLRPLARIVSGGELSRIMLAIKTLMATSRHGFSAETARPPSAAAPGLIFDEVDAGIGGRVADVVGRKLRTLGSAFQVLCITHLPQIAAYADTHFQITKQVGRGRTSTSVRRLVDGERVEEMARMLGGEGISDGIRRSAREMLDERRGPGGPAPGRKRKGESETRKAKGKRVT
ncbi:MAG TPA: DNA repair protein RecN [Vicinamibacterales bacterium]|jgi:DNA repair protein RecN (Recombination protein N)